MINERKNQSIVITGESGAGKTESTKLVLRYLASVQKKQFNRTQIGDIEDKILYTNPVLEAFGNAKTIRNNNSSRFGKFIQIYFDDSNLIHSAEISNYLLEKSRIVMQSSEERNYHIFYMLLNSAPEEVKIDNQISKKYKLDRHKTYLNLNTAYSDSEEFMVSDSEAWKEMLKCLEGLKFSEGERDGIFRLLSAVQNLCNLKVLGTEESSYISLLDEEVEILTDILGINPQVLESLICTRALIVPATKKKICQKLSQDLAENNKQTLAKIIYDRLFDWLVGRVNIEIKKPRSGQAAKFNSIGILDIFGFEIFDVNSFEQLCINFTNEKLQNLFNSQIFAAELAAYEAEKISYTTVTFVDNSNVLQLIEGKPTSIFSFLDEQCKFSDGSDKKFVERVQLAFKDSKSFLPGPKIKKMVFGISHFAGKVFYDSTNFVDKNKYTKNRDLEEIFSSSSVDFIASLFQELDKGKQESNKSVSAQFLEQLKDLVSKLNSSSSLYIRCIKPNEVKAPKLFDSELVCTQLRCAGMLEAIRIRKCGYPIRRPIEAFCKNYKLLLIRFEVRNPNPRQAVELFIQALDRQGIIKLKDYVIQVGKTKVFMKEHIKFKLDSMLEESMCVFAYKIQRAFRKYILVKNLKIRTKSRLLIQCWWKKQLMVKYFKLKLKERSTATKKIQKFFRVKLLNFYLKRLINEKKASERYLGKSITSSDRQTERNLPTSCSQKPAYLDLRTKISQIIKHSTREYEDHVPNEFKNLQFDGSREQCDDIDSHPRFIQLEIEIQRLKKELEFCINRLHDTSEPSLSNDSLHHHTFEQLKLLLKNKDNILRATKVELEFLKNDLKKKNKEIESLKIELFKVKSVYDEEVMTQLQQVDEIISKKDMENVILRKKYEDLQSTLRAIRENSDNEIQNSFLFKQQESLIFKLRRQIEQIQTESFLRESLLHHDEQKFTRKDTYIQILKQEASCSRDIVHDLVKLLKFKEFQIGRLQQLYEEKVGPDRARELNSAYNKLKPQEGPLRFRMMEHMKRLQMLQEETQFIEADVKGYEDEFILKEDSQTYDLHVS